MGVLPEAVVVRLCEYRRHLRPWIAEGRDRIFSHELAELVGASPAQVRRDLMTIGFAGSPATGYDAERLLDTVGAILTPSSSQTMTLVGVGHLGCALLNFFDRRQPSIPLPYAFDVDPDVVGRTIGRTEVRHIDQLEATLRTTPPILAILAVRRSPAQELADRLTALGVSGILNFAPTRLKTPDTVHVEYVDITTSVDKALFFARLQREHTEAASRG